MKSFNKYTFVLCPGRKYHKTARSRHGNMKEQIRHCHCNTTYRKNPKISGKPGILIEKILGKSGKVRDSGDFGNLKSVLIDKILRFQNNLFNLPCQFSD